MASPTPSRTALSYVTARVGGHVFGIPIERVQDIFAVSQMTPVPLASPDIAGIINLRGRIVTAMDVHNRLGLPRGDQPPKLVVSIEFGGESCGLLVDEIGEVLEIAPDAIEALPANIDEKIKGAASGVHQSEGGLLVVLDIHRLLDTKPLGLAA
jgi:purine-binding chemotaxis protein CheW